MPKRRPSDQTGTWIAVGAGGGSLLMLLIVVGIGAYIYAHTGEQLAKGPINLPPPPVQPEQPRPEQPKFKDIGEKTRVTNGIRARADRPARLNELRQIALFYVQYRDNFNRPPKTADDFTQYIRTDAPAIVQAINEKYYFLVPNVRGAGIVAYEFDPDQNGRHAVAQASGSVDEMSTPELLAQLKAQGSSQ